MTDAHTVASAIDASAPAVADAHARVRLLAAKGATVVSSDWTERAVVSYSVANGERGVRYGGPSRTPRVQLLVGRATTTAPGSARRSECPDP
jgi:hypothetical protein